jgi:hypothetical protein
LRAAAGLDPFRNNEVAVKQEKTNARVWVPASDDLKAILEPWLKTHDQLVLLVDSEGRAFKIDHFRHLMRDATSPPGCPTTLRRTAALLRCDHPS